MISNLRPNLDKIVEEERKARELISSAEIERLDCFIFREDIMKKARENIKRELLDYENEMKQFLKEEISKV